MRQSVLFYCLTALIILSLHGCEKDGSSGKIPGAPSDFDAVAGDCDLTVLTWKDNAYNEEGFKISCAVGGSASFSIIATLPANTIGYEHTGLSISTKYRYHIFSFNGAGNSQIQADSTITSDICDLPPAAPSNLTGTALSSFHIIMNWSDNSDSEEEYLVVMWDLTRDKPYEFYLPANSTSYDNSNLSSGTTYSFWVCAFNKAGSSCSSTIRITTP